MSATKSDKKRLEEIIKTHEDDREIAEYAGISLTLNDYDFLIKQAQKAQRYREALEIIYWKIPGTNPQAWIMKDYAKKNIG